MNRLLVPVIAVLGLVALGGCGDDNDDDATAVTASTEVDVGDEETAAETPVTDEQPPAETPVTDEETPTEAPAEEEPPAYDFALQAEDLAGVPCFPDEPCDRIGVEVWEFLGALPGQSVTFEFIELDPEGDPCPTGAEIDVTDADGGVIVSAQGDTVVLPEGPLDGPLTFSARCVRNGEPGLGSFGPVRVAQAGTVSVDPVAVVAGESVVVELEGGVPDGSRCLVQSIVGTDAELAADGTATFTVPEGLSGGPLMLSVGCWDGINLIDASARVEVSAG